MPRRFAAWWPLAAIVALTLLFFYRLAFTNLILARGDAFAYFYPYWDVRNAALLQGRLPLWSPNLFMGLPLLANSQLGTFYPPNWLFVGLPAPDGIRLSILLHAAWAMLGAYSLARRTLGLGQTSALLAGVVYSLGGYAGAHVEQINQLQGLSWMPWLFLAFHTAVHRAPRYTLLLSIGLALQFLSGHTQTVFITLVGLGLYGLMSGRWRFIPILVAAGLLALLLASPQLIPSFELIQFSNRRGGLNQQQAMAFSLNPFMIGRGLLPSYDALLFGEYIAYTGVIGLGLALVGVFTTRHQGEPRGLSRRLIWTLMALTGFALALGVYNPLYWPLATLPGFNLFRVPARWLALFALAVAMLAGMGLQTLFDHPQRPRLRVFIAIVLLVGLLAGLSTLASRTPDDIFEGSGMPTRLTVMAWGLALASLLVLMWLQRGKWRYALPVLAMVELFAASAIMAYNDLAPPEIYSAQRFTASQLRVYAGQQIPPGRLLSISNLFFDPGDKATLEARYAEFGLDALSVRHALVATKMQETLAPNLPLAWDVPSIDGFDGGLLPSAYYTAFTSVMLPPDRLRTVDGRLRELLAREECRGACLPEQRWLNLTNTHYLIVDKTFDLTHEGIFYDTQMALTLESGESDSIRYVPEFESTAVDALYLGEGIAGFTITLTYDDGDSETLRHSGDDLEVLDGLRLARLTMHEARTPVAIEIEADRPMTLRALTLVDTRTGDFIQLALGPWRRVLSSDIKVYENLEVMPRAFVIHDLRLVADDEYGTEDALTIMRMPAVDLTRLAVLAVDTIAPLPGGETESSATVMQYSAERVEIEVEADAEGYLLLTDAYYPGWTATVNGVQTVIIRADAMFRAVRVPEGKSTVLFEYRPVWLPWAVVLGAAAWLGLLVVIVIVWGRKGIDGNERE